MRASAAGLVLAAAAASFGCAARVPGGADLEPAATAPAEVGLYRGHITDSSGKTRRFRLMLFAARPDRLHGELLGPLGAPQLIVDGGGGRLAITLPRDRTAYVGAADPRHVGRALGLELGLDQLVAAVLDGVLEVQGYELVREAGQSGALPEALEVIAPDLSLSLALRERRTLGEPAASLGTGRAPEGVVLRPLEELGPDDVPLLAGEADPS